MAPAPKLLATYLNDHLAGSVVGTQLARRIAKQNDDNDYGREIASVAKQIEEDQADLRRIMDRLDVRQKRTRLGIAWAGAKFGRLKPNGRLVGYSPLSRVIELEGLMLGITGKLALWRSLERVEDSNSALDGAELKRLIGRAEDQRDRVEALRVKAASEALTQD
jgi:hypothetical protein